MMTDEHKLVQEMFRLLKDMGTAYQNALTEIVKILKEQDERLQKLERDREIT